MNMSEDLNIEVIEYVMRSQLTDSEANIVGLIDDDGVIS